MFCATHHVAASRMMDLIHKEGPIMLRRAANSFGTANVEPIIRLWLLRFWFRCVGAASFSISTGFTTTHWRKCSVWGTGSTHRAESSISRPSSLNCANYIRRLRISGSSSQSALLGHNVRQLSKLVGLSTNDCKVLVHRLYPQRAPLNDAAD